MERANLVEAVLGCVCWEVSSRSFVWDLLAWLAKAAKVLFEFELVEQATRFDMVSHKC